MKKIFTFLILLGFCFQSLAATYRTYKGYTQSTSGGNTTYVIWINSDTAFGETALGEIQYNGSTYTGIIDGVYDTGGPASLQPANWRITITIPSSASNVNYQLATRNQGGSNYGFTGFGPLGPLPVTFSAFSAKAQSKSVRLDWTTSQEENNAYFEIERSRDVSNWTKIGQVEGSGTTKSARSYAFEDYTAPKGVNYYRITQVDGDGTRNAYPRVRDVLVEVNPDLAIYPNPSSDKIKFAGVNEDAQVSLYDAKGLLYLNQKISTANNEMSLENLSEGIYLVRIVDETTTKVMRVVVRK